MKICVISDVHLGKDHISRNPKTYPRVSTYGASAKEILRNINFEHYDLIVNCGDAILDQDKIIDKKNLQQFKDQFPEDKTIHIVGNHDQDHLTKQEILHLFNQKTAHFSFDKGGLHHIILDPIWQGDKYVLPKNQIDWLKEDLDKTNKKTIVYLHYPLHNQDMEFHYFFKDHQNHAFVQNKEEIRKLLEQSKKVCLVVNGHIHYYHQEIINDIIYVTCPSLTENDGSEKPGKKFLAIEISHKNPQITLSQVNESH